MTPIRMETMVDLNIYGIGSNRFARHEVISHFGPDISGLSSHLELPLVSFKMLRETVEFWGGGEMREDGSNPGEFYLTHGVVIGSNQAMKMTEYRKLLADATRLIVNPLTEFQNGRMMMESGAQAFKAALKMREEMERKRVKTSRWGILLPHNILFTDGTRAEIRIDTKTGLRLNANLWVPPLWNELCTSTIEGQKNKPPIRVFTTMMQVRPPCSDGVQITQLQFPREGIGMLPR